MNTENSKTNETHKFALNLSHTDQILEAPINMLLFKTYHFITSNQLHYIKKHYKINKLKIIAPAWNDEFELPDGY